jgi:hypothetical protein
MVSPQVEKLFNAMKNGGIISETSGQREKVTSFQVAQGPVHERAGGAGEDGVAKRARQHAVAYYSSRPP